MEGWFAVDFDGCLAHYDEWKGEGVYGAPVPRMVALVRAWLEAGQKVKIFTARANSEVDRAGVAAWCVEHIGQELEVTATKDYGMIALWDDRCVQVLPNTGIPLQERYEALLESHIAWQKRALDAEDRIANALV